MEEVVHEEAKLISVFNFEQGTRPLTEGGTKALSLDNVSGCIYVYLIGLLVALVSFVLEALLSKICRKVL